MRIAITGGSGFIGKHLLKELEGKHEIRLLAHQTELPRLKGVEAVEGSVLKKSSLKPLCKDTKIAIHMAAAFDASADRLVEINAQGTSNFIDECIEAGVKRFILFSSAAVYGEVEGGAPTESCELKPDTPYGRAKKMAEEIVERRVEEEGMSVVILRLTNVYGPGGRGVLTKYVQSVLADKPVILQGDGMQERDFIYVEDVVKAVIKVLEKEEKGVEKFNISSGRKISLKKLIELVEKVLGKKAKVKKEPERQGSVKCLWADNSKAEEVLGWKPKVGLEEGIRRSAGKS